MRRLLSGYLVIESSMLLNGATTGMHLADLGADVVKIESPFLGDYIRIDATKHLHVQVNRGKRSLALDLRSEAGREVLHRLLARADVLVTNARGDANSRIGLGYDQVREIKPDIVYCQNTGYGRAGPYGLLPTHGQMMDALAGGLPFEMDDEGLTRPVAVARRTGTMTTGGEGTAAGAVQAALHIAAGLAHRERTGEGCYLDVSSAEAVLAGAWTAACGQLNVPAERRWHTDPERARAVARYQSYRAADGRFLLFCPEEDRFWHRFCDAVDRPDLKDRQNGVSLRHELQAVFDTRTLAEWMDFAVATDVPLGPAYTDMSEIREDPQIRAREILVDGLDPDGKPFTHIGSPVMVSGQPFEVGGPAPNLGEHTDAVLAELGYPPEEIARLAADRVTTSTTREERIPGNLYGEESTEA